MAASKKPIWRIYEEMAAEHLMGLVGEPVTCTSAGADGGLDLESSSWAGQVKAQASEVNRPTVQALVGAAMGKKPVFYSLGGYKQTAETWAEGNGVCLFQFTVTGDIVAVNPTAKALAESSTSGKPSKLHEELKKAYADYNREVARIEQQHKHAAERALERYRKDLDEYEHWQLDLAQARSQIARSGYISPGRAPLGVEVVRRETKSGRATYRLIVTDRPKKPRKPSASKPLELPRASYPEPLRPLIASALAKHDSPRLREILKRRCIQ